MSLPVYGEYDVIIAGGGTAGFAAGVSAARAGEKDAFLGGTATGGLISHLWALLTGRKPKMSKG